MVAGTLSQILVCMKLSMDGGVKAPIGQKEVHSLTKDFLRLHETREEVVLAYAEVRSTFFDKIKSRLFIDKKLSNL